MIVTKLYGGLGNQLFQFWSSLEYAKRNNYNLCFDVRAFDIKSPGTTKRKIEILELISFFENYKINNFFDNFKYDLLCKIGRMTLLKDRQNGRLINQKNSQNLILDGHWQNYHNLINSREYIKKTMFKLKKYSLNDFGISSDKSLMIHVRRGDYVSNSKANRHHGVLSREYFLKAFETIHSHKKLENVLVFSEDLEWCKKNLEFNLKTSFIHDFENLSPMDYLLLMSEAENFVLSHSSYSWWAAFLGENMNSKIIMPSIWDKFSAINIDRLALPKWSILETKID